MSTRSHGYLMKQSTPKKTPQSQPIPGREKEMVRNSAGGFSFQADSWLRLDRFLILGTSGGTYYVGEHDLTKENVDNVRACIENDGLRVVRTVVDISTSGRAPKNDPALYVLALAASYGSDPKVRTAALAALPKVARTGTHLFTFVAFIDTMRGWGPALRKAIDHWYTSKSPEKLGYQLVKYQQRDGWSNRDLFRLAHVGGQNSPLYRWVTKNDTESRTITLKFKSNGKMSGQTSGHAHTRQYSEVSGTLPDIIRAFEEAKTATDEKRIVQLIRDFGLTREMIPTEYQKSPAVWEALLDKMPLMAMVRTLGRMGSVGILNPLSVAEKTVVERLHDRELLKKAPRVHPIAYLTALLTYKTGRGQRGHLTWPVSPKVVDALDDAFYSSFDFVEPTNKRFYVGIDVSASMIMGEVVGVPGMSPNMGAAAMAMLVARTEPNHFIGGFSTRFIDLGVSSYDRIDSAMAKCRRSFGGTDCAIAINHALQSRYPVDVFVIISDDESWSGGIHPAQAIQQYRQKTGIDAKIVGINMTANKTTLMDPKDAGVLDVVGFDASIPSIINQFVGSDNAQTKTQVQIQAQSEAEPDEAADE